MRHLLKFLLIVSIICVWSSWVDAVEVTLTPASGTIVAPGQEVTLEFVVNNGGNLLGATFYIQGFLGGIGIGGPGPYSTTVKIPNRAGRLDITATAFVEEPSGVNVLASTFLMVEPTTPPVDLLVSPLDMNLSQIGQNVPLNVIGILDDGSEIELTSSDAGTTYSTFSGGESVLKVDPDGLVIATGEGEDLVLVTNGDLVNNVLVKVTITNNPPALSPLTDVTMNVGEALNIPLEATDPDGDELTISGISLPGFATVVDLGNGNGQLELNPTAGDEGIHSFGVGVDDNGTPPFGNSVPVTVTVLEAGPNSILVPPVEGEDQASAETLILNAGLTVGSISTSHSSTVAAGKVISQNPSAGDQVPADTSVDLVISLGPPNQSPVADAGGNQTVECTSSEGARVTINGSGSYDPDGDDLTYNWTGSFGSVTGVMPEILLPLGSTEINLTVDDVKGATDSDEATLLVQDTTAPTINSLSADPNILWPPNHKMFSVAIDVSASDVCDSVPPACRLTSVSSNEAINGPGTGNSDSDWEITGDLSLNLRAERAGRGSGRVYSIMVECTDAGGNAATDTVDVSVPHDRRGR